jgi:predicted transcriptional regulator
MHYTNSIYTADGSRIKLGSQGHKMLKYIVDNGTVSKYELVTKVLGKIGSRYKLRGYYSAYMRGWMDHGILKYNHFNSTYEVTDKGACLLADLPFRA